MHRASPSLPCHPLTAAARMAAVGGVATGTATPRLRLRWWRTAAATTTAPPLLLLALLLLIRPEGTASWAATTTTIARHPMWCHRHITRLAAAVEDLPGPAATDDAGGSTAADRAVGDAVRAAAGVRPSLYPLTINIVAQFLREHYEALHDGGYNATAAADLSRHPGNSSLPVALRAAGLATAALAARARHDDNPAHLRLAPEEQQTVVGRAVNVAARLPQLTADLVRVGAAHAARLERYGEWGSFGLLRREHELLVLPAEGEEAPAAATGPGADNDRHARELHRALRAEPLLALQRAECLLALFLHRVEAPGLALRNATVPGGSDAADFLDADRRELLLSQ